MLYEFRTYTLKPGTTAEFEKRFGAALPSRVKHSELAAFWHTDIGPLNQVIHVWSYENLKQRAEIRAKAAQEPNWPPPTTDLILSMQSEILFPPPFRRNWAVARSWATSTKCASTSINPAPSRRSSTLGGSPPGRTLNLSPHCGLPVVRNRRAEPLDAYLAL